MSTCGRRRRDFVHARADRVRRHRAERGDTSPASEGGSSEAEDIHMKAIPFLAIALAMAHTARAADDATTTAVPAPAASAAEAAPSSLPNGDFCLYPGSP